MISDVTACLVTRGDVDLQPILDSLIFDQVIIWDNSERDLDWKCAGRYLAARESTTPWVYWQDDDTIVPAETQEALVRHKDGWEIVANWGHNATPAGYHDLPLVCAGAVALEAAAWDCIHLYEQHFPLDEAFMYEADFVVGALYRDWCHVHLPFEIRDIAHNGRRLADEPWQRDLKAELTGRARTIRDHALVLA